MLNVTTEISNRFRNIAVVCSLFVICIHVMSGIASDSSGTIDSFVISIIGDGFARVAVPFFFFTSGFFLAGHVYESDWWKRAILKRILTLGVPYIMWNIIFLLYCLVESTITHTELYQYELSASGFLCAMGVTTDHFPILAPTWFLRSLMLLVGLSLLYIPILKQKTGGVCLLLALMILNIVIYVSVRRQPYWMIQSISLEGPFWFPFGIYFRLHHFPFLSRIVIRYGHNLISIIAFVISVIFVLIKAIIISRSALMGRMIGIMSIPFLMIVLFYFFGGKSLWPRSLISSAFPVFLVHPFFVRAFRIYIDSFELQYVKTSAACYVCVCLIVALTTLCTVIFLQKWLPRFMFGWRTPDVRRRFL